jgi:glycosyltransferase involved in cell wall biosynthesis
VVSASIVVCAYTEARWGVLAESVRAASAQLRAADELVLVIDHNDRLLDRARRELPHARVLANEEPRGLSGARNTGVRHAAGDVVVFLDDDARPHDGWLARLTDAFTEPSVIGAGGLALPRWHEPPPRWLPAEFYWVVGCSYRGLPEEVAEIRNPIGANMAFRREVLERVGGFTDGIGRVGRTPLGCEETELAIRASTATGGRILHFPECAVDHLVTPDRTEWRYFRRRCWAEGLSKALVARSVGRRAALQSERRYATRTLPSGAWQGVVAGLRGDPGGFARTGAIVTGLLMTSAGYARGRLAREGRLTTSPRSIRDKT